MAAERVAPFRVDVVANGARLHLEVAVLMLISEATLWPENAPKLSPSNIQLRTYMGEGLVIKESAAVTVQNNGQLMEDLHLLVVEGSSPILMGREWLMRVRLDWSQLHTIRENTQNHSPAFTTLLDKHKQLFKDELGTIHRTQAKLHLDPNAQPKFHQPRNVPYAIHGRVEQALARLEKHGVIEPVNSADWATPIVPVVKKDCTIRVCGNYKVTVNQAAKVDRRPVFIPG